MPHVGAPLRRREDRPLLTGAGRFVDDIHIAGMLHVAIVRSPHAHARIDSITTAEAAGSAGVVAVVTAADLPAPGPRAPAAPLFPGVAQMLHPLLAEDSVRYVGQPVAAVVARDRYAAEDAADLVRVSYSPLPAVVDVEAALEPGAAVLHPGLGSNVAFEHEMRAGDPEGAFARADVVVEARMEQPRLAAMPMECRAIVVVPDRLRDRVDVWLSTQSAHGARDGIAEALGLSPERVHVVAPDVGGGFGAKGTLYPDEILAVHLARALRRPIKWVEDRLENLRAMVHGRGQRAVYRVAAARDGTVLAVDADILGDLGGYCLGFTAGVPSLSVLVGLGAYRIEHARFRVRGVATTKAPTGPYRGAGRPEGAYYIERMMDLVANRLGLDPADVRRRNFITTFPYRGPTGLVYDSGDYPALLERALARSEYRRWRAAQAQRRRGGGKPLGIGLATWIEVAGGGDSWETGAVRVERSGRITVLTGSSPHGQGLATAFGQIAADILGVEPGDVTVRHGDTDVIPSGIGTFGSRSLSIGGSAVVRAAEAVRDKILALAAHLLEAAPADLVLTRGAVSVRGVPGRGLTLAEIAGAAATAERRPAGMVPGLAAHVRFESTGPTTPSGAHVAVVEVDPETGTVQVLRYVAVNDCGRVVNPLLVEGQVHGGLAQGLAQALFERVVYGPDGQVLTGSLLDYAVPTSADLPEFESDALATPSPTNPLGAKGIGESGTIAAPPALVNAVIDALRQAGGDAVDLPADSDAVWRALRGTRAT